MTGSQIGSAAIGGMTRGATFSPCRRWRYALWREWGDPSRRVAFIGLNPSTADETEDDPTMRRCIAFARDWGFGAFDMLNLFAWRSTDPLGLLSAPEPVGPDNDRHLRAVMDRASRIVIAWGSHRKGGLPAIIADRVRVVQPMLRAHGIVGAALGPIEVGHLGLNADGNPKHPLYLPAITPFERITYQPL